MVLAANLLQLIHPIQSGDANRDGHVDAADFIIWSNNRFTGPGKTWDDGDFTGDGNVDGSDFNIWNVNKLLSALSPSNIDAVIHLAAIGQFNNDFDYLDDDVISLGGPYGTATDSDVNAYVQSIGTTLGDVDLDGLVNAYDFDVVMSNANQTGTTWSTGDFNGDSVTNIYDYVIWYNNRTDPSLNGDLSFNGSYGVDDIDEMFEALAITSENSSDPYYQSLLTSMYDLNGDGTINQADADYLVETLLGTAYGDANYDGVVNATDLNIVVLNLYTSVNSWADGDFNGDGIVDDDDMDLLLLNWGFGL